MSSNPLCIIELRASKWDGEVEITFEYPDAYKPSVTTTMPKHLVVRTIKEEYEKTIHKFFPDTDKKLQATKKRFKVLV